eukprot:6700850-Prymnesium_polylepis.1
MRAVRSPSEAKRRPRSWRMPKAKAGRVGTGRVSQLSTHCATRSSDARSQHSPKAPSASVLAAWPYSQLGTAYVYVHCSRRNQTSRSEARLANGGYRTVRKH